MDWTGYLLDAINYIEEHILDDISLEDVSNHCNISSFYFQKAFSVYTGISLAEYIRNRRLYMAALDIRSNEVSIIDIAYKYKYETPEAFSKAFSRFHGVSPVKVRDNSTVIKPYLPLKIKISITGGKNMDYVVEEVKNLKLIGFSKNINANEGYQECPKFWDEFSKKCMNLNDNSDIAKAIKKYHIGAFAACINNEDHKSFKYVIAGIYDGDEKIPGLEVIELPESLWAKFKCFGPLPGALQAVNTKIWEEWMPNNKEYDLSYEADIEFYPSSNTQDPNYECEIWLPVKRK